METNSSGDGSDSRGDNGQPISETCNDGLHGSWNCPPLLGSHEHGQPIHEKPHHLPVDSRKSEAEGMNKHEATLVFGGYTGTAIGIHPFIPC